MVTSMAESIHYVKKWLQVWQKIHNVKEVVTSMTENT